MDIKQEIKKIIKYEKDHRKADPNEFWISQIGFPDLRLWFDKNAERLGLTPNEIKPFGKFLGGTAGHEILQKRIEEMGYDCEIEKQVIFENDKIKLTGRIDLILDNKVIDFKFIKPWYNRNDKTLILYRKDNVSHQYLCQINAYACIEEKNWVLISFNKVDYEVHEGKPDPYFFNDNIVKLEDIVDAKEEFTCDSANSWWCGYCPHSEYCKSRWK